MTDEPQPSAGWYPDPSGSGGLRWWDGTTWSDATHEHPDAPPSGAGEAPPYEGSGGDAAPRVRRSVWSVLLVLALLAVVVVAVATLVTSLVGRSRLDTAVVEQQIAQTLSAQTSQTTTVTCPDEVSVSSGATFTCSATTADGRSATILVTQLDDSGHVQWKIQG